MKKQRRLYVNQYGDRIYAGTVKELVQKAGYSKAHRMYRDKKDGRTVHVGYVVGPYWYTMYVPLEIEVSP